MRLDLKLIDIYVYFYRIIVDMLYLFHSRVRDIWFDLLWRMNLGIMILRGGVFWCDGGFLLLGIRDNLIGFGLVEL